MFSSLKWFFLGMVGIRSNKDILQDSIAKVFNAEQFNIRKANAIALTKLSHKIQAELKKEGLDVTGLGIRKEGKDNLRFDVFTADESKLELPDFVILKDFL